MSSSASRSAGAPAAIRPSGESGFGSTLGPGSHPARTDDSVGGVVRFALIENEERSRQAIRNLRKALVKLG